MRRGGIAASVALVLAVAAAAPALAQAPDDTPSAEQRLIAIYMRGYLMARYCARHGSTFSATDADRVQDELNRITDASSLSEDDKARIWNSLQSNLNSMGGEVTAEDCGSVKTGLIKLMPQAFAETPGGR